MAPHSLTMTIVGTGLLWVGWFGFNAGSALEANGSAALAMINTFVATAGCGAGLDAHRTGRRPQADRRSAWLSGIVAGLVAVTPAAGNSGPVRRDLPRRGRRLDRLLPVRDGDQAQARL